MAAQTRRRTETLADPQSDTAGFGAPVPALAPPPHAGEVVLEFQHAIVTAQKVAVARDENRIMARLKALCARSGDKYYYSWEANDRRNQRKSTVEGPTIGLANDLAREYGNNVVDIRAIDTGDGWMFYARFTDLETGFSMTRPFQQRKDQDTGMSDGGRAMDIVFQIGASKAIRNVIVNSLSTYKDFMMEEAKKALVDWVDQHPEKAAKWIADTAAAHSIDMRQIEAVIGRIHAQWTVRDIARVMAELRGIDEGLTVADEVYPSLEDAQQVMAEKQTKADDGLRRPESNGAAPGASAPATASPQEPVTAPTAASTRPAVPQPAQPASSSTDGAGVADLF